MKIQVMIQEKPTNLLRKHQAMLLVKTMIILFCVRKNLYVILKTHLLELRTRLMAAVVYQEN